MDDILEPRTNADIVRDLLGFVQEHEWVSGYERCPRNCCDDYFERCPECRADAGDYKNRETYRVHKPGCRLAAIILESEAFLSVEEELAAEVDHG